MRNQRPLELLVSTITSFFLVSIDPASLRPLSTHLLHQGFGTYYGITFDNEHVYCLCRHSFAAVAKPEEILVFDRNLVPVGARSLEAYKISEAHQMVVWRGCFHICNTSRNCLTILDRTGAASEDFYPVPACRGHNLNHLNSVYIDGERLIVGFANRFRNSFVMRFDFRTRRLQQVDALGLVAHNIVPRRGGMLLCDSLSGCLMYSPWEPDEDGRERDLVRFALRPEEAMVDVTRIGMETVCQRHQAKASCCPRGLAVHGDVVAVGVSELSRRSGRRDTLGRVMLLKGIGEGSLPGSQTAAVIDLGETGAVMDCRFVNCRDLGHPMPDGTAPPRCIGE